MLHYEGKLSFAVKSCYSLMFGSFSEQPVWASFHLAFRSPLSRAEWTSVASNSNWIPSKVLTGCTFPWPLFITRLFMVDIDRSLQLEHQSLNQQSAFSSSVYLWTLPIWPVCDEPTRSSSCIDEHLFILWYSASYFVELRTQTDLLQISSVSILDVLRRCSRLAVIHHICSDINPWYNRVACCLLHM